jgi:hypothetical protein
MLEVLKRERTSGMEQIITNEQPRHPSVVRLLFVDVTGLCKIRFGHNASY